MVELINAIVAPLFVPGNRPELIAKALRSGADAIVFDLEDAVAPNDKTTARQVLASNLPADVIVRINGSGTEWFDADIASLGTKRIIGVMLPKTESADAIARLRAQLSGSPPVVALVETAVGLENVGEIASAADRLAFGSIDLSVDLGCSADAEALLYARSRLVLAARLARKPAPLDGVTANFRDLEACKVDAIHAAKLGFGGRLCIHPDQVPVVRLCFNPSDDDVAWARRVLGAGEGAVAVEGTMVDAPVRLRARQILARHEKAVGLHKKS